MKKRNLKTPSALCAIGASLLTAHATTAQSVAPQQEINSLQSATSEAVPAPSADTAASTLVIVFRGMKTTTGAIMVSLSKDPAEFSGSKPAVAQDKLAVNGPEAAATFTGLLPGRYAVRAFHDLDGDGKLKTNAFGAPLEPYAFSNNARGLAGPPSWDAASFAVKPGLNVQSIPID